MFSILLVSTIWIVMGGIWVAIIGSIIFVFHVLKHASDLGIWTQLIASNFMSKWILFDLGDIVDMLNVDNSMFLSYANGNKFVLFFLVCWKCAYLIVNRMILCCTITIFYITSRAY